MTEKQQRFADEYIICLNATQAAIKAGYARRSAGQIGEQNLKKLEIKSYIDERLEQLKSEKVADQREVLEFLTSAMRGEVTEPLAILDGDGMQRLVDVRPNVATRKAAAELLGKRYRMWTDKVEQAVDFDGNLNITIDYGDEDEVEDTG